MRDPNRIPEVLKELEAVWRTCPDLRLGQLIMNAFGIRGNTQLFYCEDDDFVEAMKAAYDRPTDTSKDS